MSVTLNGFAEKHIQFFDSVVLFADFWKKNSCLKIDFTLSSSTDSSKVVFHFPDENEEELSLFQQHVIRHFLNKAGKHVALAGKVELSHNIVEIWMNV